MTTNPPPFRREVIAYCLRRHAAFADLPERDLFDLATDAVLRPLDKGAYLFRRHEAVSGLYLVRRGILNLHRVANDGREVVIHFYREGELLAQLPAADHAGCPADARALVNCEVVVIPWRSLLAKIRRCPELSIRIFGALEFQIHRLADSLENLASKSACARFVEWLVARCDAEPGPGPCRVELAMTKRALAEEIGVRQETLSRILRRLTRDGHVRVEGHALTVRSPETLRHLWVDDGEPARAEAA